MYSFGSFAAWLRPIYRLAASTILIGASATVALPTGSIAAAAQAQSDAFVATALGIPEAGVQLDGPLTHIAAADQSLFRVGTEAPSASPAILLERGAYATMTWDARPDALFGSGGAFDCASSWVACPGTELRLERFDRGATLFVWDLAGAVERPTGSQILRVAVLANDPRYPALDDARPNTPFTQVNKVWVMDYTATGETMRFFQVDAGKLREYRSDAISAFNGDRGFTAIAPQAFEGVTQWNIHTYSLAGPDEGGHSLVAPGGGLIQIAGPAIQLTATPPESCAPRAPVGVAATRLGEGVLEVTVKAGNGALVSLNVTDGPNWIIDPNTPVQVPDGATELTFRVLRNGPGAVHVPIAVVDGCGSWQTFVGGGTGAF
jgi:hypothetical protein